MDLIRGTHNLKQQNGTVVTIGNGRLMWDVAADYLRKQKHLDLQKVNHPTIKGVKNNPGIENYAGKII